MAVIKGIFRGYPMGSLDEPEFPEYFVPKVALYGTLEIQEVDMSKIYIPGSGSGKPKWKNYYINGRPVEPRSVQRVKRIPEDYKDPYAD